ncbi:MAG: YbeD family protein [Pseudohongiellaceae bacterium]
MSADSTSSNQEPSKIKFPCLYPIKIIGKAVDDFQVSVIAAVERYTGTITSDLIKVQPSRQNNYLSVTITIAATGEDQLKNIFLDLKKIESVKMVL